MDPVRGVGAARALAYAVGMGNGLRTTLLAVAGAGVLAAGAARAGDGEPPRGAALLAPFQRELQQALAEGLARGPVEAISACRVRAPEIAADLSREGVRMGRASHRLRNPDNAPPDWVAPVLERYLAEPSHREPATVALPGEREGYVTPIVTQPPCLTCHGEDLAPEVEARLEALYPDDRAVGFRAGELRGVFWVAYPTRASATDATEPR